MYGGGSEVKKQHVQIGVIGIGVLALPFLIMANLKKPEKKPEVSGPLTITVSTEAPDAMPAKGSMNDKTAGLQSQRWDMPWGRDPFMAISDNVGKLNEFQLKGISFSRNKKGYAFINDQIAAVGETIGEYEVAAIEKDRVMLKRGAQTFYLTFTEQQ
jgi:type II secretory pathway component PulC